MTFTPRSTSKGNNQASAKPHRKPEGVATTKSTPRQRGTKRRINWVEAQLWKEDLTLQVVKFQEEGCDMPHIHINTCHLSDLQTWKTGPSQEKGGEGTTGSS
jgi:hypothetical protein